MMKRAGTIPCRYVASLDVLGFRNSLEKDIFTLAQAYLTAIKISKKTQKSSHSIQETPWLKSLGGSPPEGKSVPNHPHIFKVAVFSDSIFVFTDDETEDSLIDLCEFCFLIYREFLRQGLPLRGGIARGEAIVMPEESLYLGKAIVDAWIIEQSLDLTGIVLAEGLSCAATAQAVATFKVKDTPEGRKENRSVPVHRSSMVKGDETHARQFQLARAKAGKDFARRYENSESVIAAMFKMDPSLLRPMKP